MAFGFLGARLRAGNRLWREPRRCDRRSLGRDIRGHGVGGRAPILARPRASRHRQRLSRPSALCEEALTGEIADAERSDVLWILVQVALRGGIPDRSLAAAEEKRKLDLRRGAEREAAISAGFVADIFEARGQLDEALKIRNEEELPVYERLGDVRSRAVTTGKIADILQARGQLDEALKIRNEEELPVYQRFDDVCARAVTMAWIANIQRARGDRDGAVRSLCEEVLPVYGRLGDAHSLLRGRWQLAGILLERASEGDRDEAGRLLQLALDAARRLKLPEARQIQEIIGRTGLEIPPLEVDR
jgi:tetratricopeptide (TPR) repeat protein